MEIYQKRYLQHQKRKSFLKSTNKKAYKYSQKVLSGFVDILGNRRSQRIFNDKEIKKNEKQLIISSAVLAPTSCNRQAIKLKETENVEDLETLLVGGKNWIKNAKIVYLLFADMKAYKSPVEVDFMPYLDTGFVAQNMLLMAEAINIGSCFVNPNLTDKEKFNNLFNKDDLKFTGAVALGKYDYQIEPPTKDPNITL